MALRQGRTDSGAMAMRGLKYLYFVNYLVEVSD